MTAVSQAQDGRERAHRLIGAGVVARLVGTGLVTVLGIASTSLALRLLGSAPYGVLAFAASTGALLVGLARLGLEPGFARAVTSARAADPAADLGGLTRGATLLTLAGGAAAGVVVVVAVAFAPGAAGGGTRLLVGSSLALFAVAANAAAVTGALARGLGRMPVMEVPNVTLSAGRLLALAAVAAAGLGTLRWVAGAYALAAAVTLVVCGLLASRLAGPGVQLLRADVREATALLRTAAPFAVTGLAALVLSRVDVVVLGLTHSSSTVAAYEPLLKLVEQALLFAPILFIGPFLPAATRLYAAGDRDGFRDLYLSSSKLVFAAALPAILILAVDPVETAHLLYGGAYHVRSQLVWILIAGFAVNVAFGLNTNALAAAGTRRELVRVGVVGLVAMLLLAGILVPLLGAAGAAAATSATYVVVNVTASAALRRTTGVVPFDRSLALVIGTAPLPLAALVGVHRLAGDARFTAHLAEALAAWLAWLALLAALRAVSADELRRLLPRGSV